MSPPHQTTQANNIAHILGFIGYVFISEILFLFVVKGWDALAYIALSAPVYLLALVILLMRSGSHRLSFNKNDWKFLLTAQGLLLLISFRDSAEGIHAIFFQKIFKVNAMLELRIIGIAALIYALFLFKLVIGKSSRNK